MHIMRLTVKRRVKRSASLTLVVEVDENQFLGQPLEVCLGVSRL